ncbi:hypothetical protein [Trueperella bernardiae]|uniref:hypothetical protein n=1 Tax=Trueperella bernardiae TaxID=59561 RepID=UPI00288C3E84|nr:hypothetical protein [Trueperella bernardiae]
MVSVTARITIYNPDGELRGRLSKPTSWSASIPWNDVSAFKLDHALAAPGAELLAEPGECALEIWDGAAWVEPAGARYCMMETSTDRADRGAGKLSITAPGYATLLDGVVVIPQKFGQPAQYDSEGKRKFLSATVGEILTTVLAEARGLEPGLVPGLSLAFTKTTDSAGAAWARRVTIYYEPGLSLLTILDNLAQQGQCDWHMKGRALHVTNVTNPDPLAVYLPETVKEAPVRTSLSGLAHTGFLVGERDTWRFENEGTPTPWGKTMKVITQGGVRDEGTARQLVTGALAEGARQRVEYTWAAPASVEAPRPFVDFRPGERIYARNVAGEFEPMRVAQVALSFGSDGLETMLTLNDRFTDSMIRIAKRTKGIVNGASGDAGTSTTPEGLKAAPPKPVEGLTLHTEGYWDGPLARSLVRASWGEVTHDIRGSATQIAEYRLEMAGRTITTTETTGTVSDLAPDQVVTATVTAADNDGQRSAPTSLSIRTAYPLDRLDPPTRLTGSSEYGIVSLYWDGLLDPGAGGTPYTPPRHFSRLLIEEAPSANGPWVPLTETTGRQATIDRNKYIGQTRFYRATAIDHLSGKSDPGPANEVQVRSTITDQLEATADQLAELTAKAQDAHNAAIDAQAAADRALAEYGPIDERTQAAQAAAQAAEERANAAYALAEEKPDLADVEAAAEAAADAARQAAAADAQAKADAAKSEALAQAAQDAQAKANAAKAAAEQAAEFAAQAAADAAEQAAIDAAAQDAQAKADAAKAAAQEAAEAAAQAAQAAAEQAAAADAKAKADAALAAARAELAAAQKLLDSKITTVQASANGKNSITVSRQKWAASTPGKVAGDLWRWVDGSGNLIGEATWDGAAWKPSPITSAAISALDVHKLTVTGNAQFSKAVIDRFWVNEANAGKVTARMMNVVADPKKGGTEFTPTKIGMVGPGGLDVLNLEVGAENALAFYQDYQARFAVSSDGSLSAISVNAAQSLTYQGEELADILERIPKGIVYFAENINGLFTIQNASYTSRIAHIPVTRPKQPRFWRITARAGIQSNTASNTISSGIHMQIVSNTSAHYDQAAWRIHGSVLYQTSGYYWETVNFVDIVDTRDINWSSDGHALISWTARNAAGSSFTIGQGMRFWIEDLGPAFNRTPTYPWIRPEATSDSGSSPTKTTSTASWGMAGSEIYRGSGKLGHTSGNLPAGYYSGEWKSLIFFNDASIRSVLSGATINQVRLYLANAHTHAYSGMTARIGTHNAASAPYSAPSLTHWKDEAFSRGQAKWVTLPTGVGEWLRNGSARGIALAGWSTSSQFYGTFLKNVRLEITYTK